MKYNQIDATILTANDTDDVVTWEGLQNDDTRQDYCSWLVCSGRPVAMVRYSHHDDNWMLCDIEVREDERGRGLGMEFLNWLMENICGETMYTTGSFTPKGARSLQPHLVVESGYALASDPGIKFDDMNFVYSWDDMLLLA